MAHTYSDAARRNLLATSADEPYLTLLEIRHPDLAEPVRLVNDVENITINNPDLGPLVYIACPFRLVKPDDVDQQLPRATLEVDNIGRELTQWLEASNGGKGARCRLMECLRSSNEDYAEAYFAEDYTLGSNIDIEFDMELDLAGLYVDNQVVGGELGFENTLHQAAVTKRFDPTTAPGLW